MADLNQGASIEAEREFEAWWESEGQYIRAGGGDYEKCFAYGAWNRRTPAAAAGAMELPPLPEGCKAYEYTGTTIVYGAEEVREVQRAAITADRAQQAGAAAPITYTVDGVTMSPLEYIAYLHDQLAAKGQGVPVAWAYWMPDHPHDLRHMHVTTDLRYRTLNHRPLVFGDALAAPASAQPADPHCKWPTCQSEEVQRQVADQVHRELYSGAQPDQRESAAEEGCTQPMLEAAMKVAVASGLIAKYADGESYLRNWDGMKACVNAALAAAPTSPAAQPTNNKGESA
jgi:hypothetical protein